MIYDNTEFYIQDNWKVNNRMTLDYGMRFTRQGPQYDQFQQMSNFFPEEWNKSQQQVLYVPGCSNGAVTCSGNTLNAMDPRNGQILTAPGTLNTQAAIGDADSRVRKSAQRHSPGRRRHRRYRATSGRSSSSGQESASRTT